MTDTNKEAKAAEKAASKAEAKANREAKAKAKAEDRAERSRKGIRLGPQPDHKTMHTIRVRTQGGHKLWIPSIEFWAPGEEAKVKVTAAQLERLEQDGRIMIDDQIDAYELEIKGMKDRTPHGTRVKGATRTKIPDGLPVNYPGGKLNRAKLPKDAKSAEELVSEERKFLEKSERERKARDKRA